MNQFKKLMFLSLIMILAPFLAWADYIGPQEVLSLRWGTGDGEMGIKFTNRGEYCSLPHDQVLFSVSDDGTIAIIDYCNQKVKYFRGGKLQRVAQPDRKIVESIMILPMEKAKDVKWQMTGEFSGKATVIFADRTYTTRHSGTFYRDRKGNLLGISGRPEVKKYDQEGKELGGFSIGYRASTGPESELGGPVLDRDGNLYIWKGDLDRFRILKWTWREAQQLYGLPDAPRYVEANPSKNGIGLRWWFPFQEKESITGFEVLRSEKSGTPPYRSLGIIQKKDITGFTFFEDTTAEKGVTYYYRMRTISEDRYSLYSNEAICKR